MRALSLTQPWATLVAIGAKAIETRSWPTSRRGWIAIHATKSFPDDAIRLCFNEPFKAVLKAAGIRVPADLPRGAIIAVARLVDCRSTGPYDGPSAPWVTDLSDQERAFGGFTWGRFGWVLEDVQALAEPIACRGYQGIWPVQPDVMRQIQNQRGTPLPAGSLTR